MLKKSARCIALFLALTLLFAFASQTYAAPKYKYISPGDFRINNGESQVYQRQVTLNFTNPKGVKNKTMMRIKNENGDFSGWQSFKNGVTWQLNAGSGQKTVTVELSYQLERRTFSASVFLIEQNRPFGPGPNRPHQPLSIYDVSVQQISGTSVEVFWRTSEPTFGLVRFNGEIRNYNLYTDDDRPNFPDGYSIEHRIQINNLTPNITYYAKIEAIDRDNRHETSPEFTFFTKMAPPPMVPKVTMQINGHAEYTNNPQVNLQFTLERQTPGMMMSLSNDGSNWSPDEPFQNTKLYTLPGGDGRKTIYARFRFLIGPYTQTYSDSIILDTRAPQITDIRVDQISGDTVEIRWRTDEPAYGLILYNRDIRNFGLRTGDNRSSNFGTENSIRINRLDPGRTYYAKIEAIDRAENHGFSQEFSFSARPQDTTPPTGSIRINGGSQFTNSTQVTLELPASDNDSGVATMSFSNDGRNWSPDEAYQMNKSYTLFGGDGRKTIYVRFRDRAGNYSQAYSDSITLDTRAPQIVDIRVDQISGDTVEIRWRTDKPSYGLILYNREVRNFGLRTGDNRSSFQSNFGTEHSIRINRLEPGRIYYAKIEVIDMAGNHGLSQEFSFSSRPVDQTPPTGSIRINGGAQFTNSTQVTLELPASDNDSGVATMSFSNDGRNWSPDEQYQMNKSYTLFGGNGRKTIYVRFRDRAGNYSQAYSDSIELDTRAPMISNVTVNQISGDTVEIRWRTDEPAFGTVQYNADVRNYSLRSRDNRGDFQGNFGTEHAIRIDRLQPGRMYFGKIEVVDRAGNRTLSPEFQFNIPAALIPPPVTPPPVQTGINVALQSNGSKVDTTFGVDQPLLAIDGNPNTAWHLALNVEKIIKINSTQHFWQVRLKQIFNINKIRIKAISPFPFVIQYRQNNSWVTLQSVSQLNNSYVEIPTNIQADTIRLLWDHSKDNLNGLTQIDIYLFEVELYN